MKNKTIKQARVVLVNELTASEKELGLVSKRIKKLNEVIALLDGLTDPAKPTNQDDDHEWRCGICDQVLKTKQGLGNHTTRKHGRLSNTPTIVPEPVEAGDLPPVPGPLGNGPITDAVTPGALTVEQLEALRG